jgi:hypothetical protein
MEYTFPGRPPARPSCIIVICTWGRDMMSQNLMLSSYTMKRENSISREWDYYCYVRPPWCNGKGTHTHGVAGGGLCTYSPLGRPISCVSALLWIQTKADWMATPTH